MSEFGSTPPGWYHAEGDPPGTQRFWDGQQWQGSPQPAAGGTQFPAFTNAYEASQAVGALIVSILGFFCCGLLAPVGLYVGHQETVAIDAGRRHPSNRGTATAAKIIGGLACLGWGFFWLLWVIGTVASF